MEGKIEIHIEMSDYRRCLDIYIGAYPDHMDYFYLASPVNLVFEKRDYRANVEPTIKITGRLVDDFLKALAEALDKHGIKTDKDAKIEGTLEAARYHLEDLRKMLKLS